MNPGGAATSKPENVDEELSVQEQEDDQINTSSASGYYSCPHDGCIRVFQRLSALEKHLALEKCEQKLERFRYLIMQNLVINNIWKRELASYPL